MNPPTQSRRRPLWLLVIGLLFVSASLVLGRVFSEEKGEGRVAGHPDHGSVPRVSVPGVQLIQTAGEQSPSSGKRPPTPNDPLEALRVSLSAGGRIRAHAVSDLLTRLTEDLSSKDTSAVLVPKLIDITLNSKEDPAFRAAAIWLLGSVKGDDARTALEKVLRDEMDGRLVRIAMRAISSLSDASTPSLRLRATYWMGFLASLLDDIGLLAEERADLKDFEDANKEPRLKDLGKVRDRLARDAGVRILNDAATDEHTKAGILYSLAWDDRTRPELLDLSVELMRSGETRALRAAAESVLRDLALTSPIREKACDALRLQCLTESDPTFRGTVMIHYLTTGAAKPDDPQIRDLLGRSIGEFESDSSRLEALCTALATASARDDRWMSLLSQFAFQGTSEEILKAAAAGIVHVPVPSSAYDRALADSRQNAETRNEATAPLAAKVYGRLVLRGRMYDPKKDWKPDALRALGLLQEFKRPLENDEGYGPMLNELERAASGEAP